MISNFGDANRALLVKQMWRRLTEPSAEIVDTDQRGQARFLAALLLVTGPLGLVTAIIVLLIGGSDNLLNAPALYIALLAMLAGGVAYFLSRTRYYELAALLAVSAAEAEIFTAMYLDQQLPELEAGMYLIIPLLLASRLLSLRLMAVTAGVNLIGLLLLGMLRPELNFSESLAHPISFNLLVSAIALLISYYRRHLESERQMALEARIETRTTELTRLNTSLMEQIAAREHAEKELAAERNLLRTVIDLVPDFIYAKDRDSRFLVANQATLDHANFEKMEDLIGKTDFDLSLEARAISLFAKEQHVIKTGEPLIDDEEFDDITYDTPKWFLSTKIPFRNTEGDIIGLVGIGRKITEQKVAERKLAEERNLLRTVIDNFPDMIFVKDKEGQFLLANKATAWALGAGKPEALIGKTDFDFSSAEIASQYRTDDMHVINSGESIMDREEWQPNPDGDGGRLLLTTKVPLRDASGEIIGVVGIARNITDVKLAEKKLAEERNLLRTLIDNLPDHIFVKDKEGRFLIANTATIRYLGADSSEAVIGKTDFDFFSQEDAVRWRWTEQNIMSSGQTYRNNGGYITDREGQRKWVVGVKIPFRSPDGEIAGIIGIDHDYTHRRQIEEALQEAYDDLERRVAERTTALSEANIRLLEQIEIREQAEAAEREARLLAEALRDTAAALNSTFDLNEILDHIFNHVSQVLPSDEVSVALIEDGLVNFVRVRGVDAAALDLYASARFRLEDTPNLRQMAETRQPLLIKDISNYPGWIHRPGLAETGSYLGAPIISEGDVIGFIMLRGHAPDCFVDAHQTQLQAFAHQAAIAIRNVRLYEAVIQQAIELEERVAERTVELEGERAQLQAILDSISEGVVGQVGTENWKQYVNPALETMTGYGKDEFSFRLIRPETRDPDDFVRRLDEVYDFVMREGRWQGEGVVRRRDGTEFDAHFTTSRIGSPDSDLVGTVTVIRDISQEKALEEQKSRFVANASHELRTPLANLFTRLWLLRKQPERLEDHLEVLEAVADRMRRLVEDLLDHSRFERGIIPLKPQPTNLADLIAGVVRLQTPEAEKKSIRLNYDVPDRVPPIVADPERITQVFTNLITNAIHYTPDQGHVQVSLIFDEDAGEVVVQVEDTGPGIPAHLLPNIFKPFYRASERTNGTGLGLTIAKEIIDRHHGSIEVESRDGEGSRFTVHLPVGQV